LIADIASAEQVGQERNVLFVLQDMNSLIPTANERSPISAMKILVDVLHSLLRPAFHLALVLILLVLLSAVARSHTQDQPAISVKMDRK